MAYPVVMDPCLDGDHGECSEHENTPTDPEVCGGGFCICWCHEKLQPHHDAWYQEVLAYSLERRERGKQVG